MKTLLVATDFSPAATNAMNYAADMALQINAGILLFHVYQVPVSVSEVPLVLVSVDELKENAERKIEKVKKGLQHITSGKIKIDTETILGNTVDELENSCQRINPFAVIMGTVGHSAIERTIFGSTTLTAIKHLTSPVICVPKGKEYGTGIKKIGLACDFREVMETTPFAVIKDVVKSFNTELHVLNADHKNKNFKPGSPEQSTLLHTALEDLNPVYDFIEHEDLEKGINEFAEKNNLDLIIAIPKKHKLLEGLFKTSSTKQLVFESHIPVMCIHE
ncbi:MAG: universal stress protein [Chitinophagaceae bacterium]